MGTKIKILFGLLAFGAIVSVLSLFDYFNAGFASNFNLNNLASKFSFAVDTDADKDGLSNIDESYWNTDFQNPDTDGDGFKDGEEVASSHDPNKPGPDDSLKDINLTEKLAELTASGLYEGSLKPEDDKYEQSLSVLADYTNDGAYFSLNGDINISDLKIVSPSKENQNKYLDNIYEIIVSFLNTYGEELRNLDEKLDIVGNNGFDDKTINQYFASKKIKFKELLDNAAGLEIPENWKNEHMLFLKELRIAVDSNNAIILGDKDPVKATVALNQLLEILDRIPDWSQMYINKNRDSSIKNLLIESLAR